MEKVKITKEQAVAIRRAIKSETSIYFKSPDSLLETHMYYVNRDKGKFAGRIKALNEMRSVTLAKALYIGYEVEPEFKVGDWVVWSNLNGQTVVVKVIAVQYEHKRIQFDEISDWQSIHYVVRHATPGEIKQEKERRWWSEIGREVDEYKIGDIAMLDSGTPIEINKVIGEEVLCEDDESWSLGDIKLICPREKRFDKDVV